MFISCCRPEQSNDSFCLSKKTIIAGYIAGVTIVALGIILAAVYWPRGSLQVLMTHEGQAVIGLVLGGIFLSSVFGAILLYAHHKKTQSANHPISPKIKRKSNPAYFDFKNAKTLRVELFKTKPIKYLTVNGKYIIGVVQQKNTETSLLIFDREKFSEKKSMDFNVTCEPIFLTDNTLAIPARDAEKSFIIIYKLKEEKIERFIEMPKDTEITSIALGKEVEFGKLKRAIPQVLFVGNKKGGIDFINYETGSKIRESLEVDTRKISSIVFEKSISLTKNTSTPLLICGTEKCITFWDLSLYDAKNATLKPLETDGSQICVVEGKSLVSITKDTATIWNVQNFSETSTMNFHNKVINLSCLGWDKKYGATGSEGGQILFWSIDSQDPVPNNFSSGDGKAIQFIAVYHTTIFTQNSAGSVVQWDFDFGDENQNFEI